MGVNATLQSVRATSAKVSMAAWGCTYADLALDGEHTLTGRGSLTIGDLSCVCTVLSGGPQKGRSSYVVVGGYGGWGRTLPEKSYANDAQVKWSTVIGDAASACGEQFDLTTIDSAKRTGPAFVRPSGPASRVLELLAPAGWYVGEDGVTRLGRRPTTVLATSVPRVTPVDRARLKVSVAPESLKALVPGITIDDIEAVDVLHEVAPDGVRTTIWGSLDGSADRKVAAFRKLAAQIDPDRPFRGVTEYRVVTQSGERLNLQAVLKSGGMPDLERVPVRPGVSGCRSDVMLGSYVLVAFVNADPGRPVVVAFEDPEGEGFTPLLTEIDASTFVKLGAGVKPAIAAGDLAGGIWPCVPTQVKVTI